MDKINEPFRFKEVLSVKISRVRVVRLHCKVFEQRNKVTNRHMAKAYIDTTTMFNAQVIGQCKTKSRKRGAHILNEREFAKVG